MTKQESTTLKPGDEMADGTIFGGHNADGTMCIYLMPLNLSVAMTFNEAAQTVDQLNQLKSFGHSDWEIPNRDVLLILSKNQEMGALREIFSKVSGKDTNWQWSSEQLDGFPFTIRHGVNFFDLSELWTRATNNNRLYLQPVRLEASHPHPKLK
tara:strand:- start:207 stop:668 length:462 start_codon:yes stop_codon:yes gene_type:complete